MRCTCNALRGRDSRGESGLAPTLVRSIGIKSVTAPIAVELAPLTGGDPALTAAVAVATGILGRDVGSWMLDRARVHDPVARGLAYGTVATGIGTAQAAMEGDIQGAVAGVLATGRRRQSQFPSWPRCSFPGRATCSSKQGGRHESERASVRIVRLGQRPAAATERAPRSRHLSARETRRGSADFVDGQGVLVDVDTWVRFNCGTPANTYASRRIALESAIPLSAELSARIEALHHAADRHPQRSLPRWVNGIFAVLPLGRVVMLFACRFGACSRYLLGHLSHQRTNPTRRTPVNSEERKQAAMTMFRGPAYATGVVLKSAVCLGLIALLVVIGSGEEKAEIAREARNDASRPTSPAKSSTLDDGYVRLETRPSAPENPVASAVTAAPSLAMSQDITDPACSGGVDGGMDANGNQCAGSRRPLRSELRDIRLELFAIPPPRRGNLRSSAGAFFSCVIQPDRGIRPGASRLAGRDERPPWAARSVGQLIETSDSQHCRVPRHLMFTCRNPKR